MDILKNRLTNIDAKQRLKRLAEQLALGDTNAIEELYNLYFKRLRIYGFQIMQNQIIVEDVVQELFIWLVENHLKVKNIQNLEAYMFQSVRRNLLSRQNKLKNHQRALNNLYAQHEQVNDSYEQEVILKEEEKYREKWVHTELSKLPNYQREIIYLRYFENKSYAEIASLLSIKEQVAYNYVSRAIKSLKKHLLNVSFLLILVFWIFK